MFYVSVSRLPVSYQIVIYSFNALTDLCVSRFAYRTLFIIKAATLLCLSEWYEVSNRLYFNKQL